MNTKANTHVYLSLLQGTPVVDAAGHMLGRLREIAVTPGPHSEVVSALIVSKKGLSATGNGSKSELLAIAPSGIAFAPSGMLQMLGNAQTRPFSTTEAFLLLDRDLLDQQIIDVHGRKVVRVNDVGFLWSQQEVGSDIRTVDVEIGTRGAVRRLLKGLASRAVVNRIAARFPSRVIPWKFVDLIEVDPARRVRLKIDHERLSQLHPSDIADILEDLAPAMREAVFNTLDEEVAAEALEEVDPKFQRSLVEGLASERVADIVEEMDPGAAADLLAELPDERSEAILEEMEPAERQEVEELLEFREDSAAGRMTTHYVAVLETGTVADAVEALRGFEDDPETVTEIYLIDANGILSGVLPLARLVLAKPETHLDVLTDSEFVSCPSKAHQNEVAELFDKYNLHALPVIDDMRRLVGVVQADHVIAFLRDAV
ncbi:MAG TPA: CBS domain-containing protein [Acidobacteriaceae bacterium]|jgi:CBS domain-containing protein/sporulation protein YlmC with PRC-barrel domain|nr:CBS domain-containing protein [Acidobacteriaceae bacterium]